MIIDLILDRKDGKVYDPKEFYNKVMDQYSVFPDIAGPIASALDSGEENDIEKQLKLYIVRGGYNKELCNYIESVEWLPTN